MKKLVMRLDLEDDKTKQKALKIVSALKGIDSITVDMKGKTMTVIGTVDPVHLVSKLRKYWHVDIITVGPAKEPEKKEAKPAAEGKKDEGKKEEGKGGEKKEEGKKEEGGDKKDNEAGEEALRKKPQPIPEHLLELRRARQYNPYMGNYPPYMGNYPPSYMGNYPPYMAMANPNMSHSHPQMYHPQPQPSYHVQRVVEEDNPSGCSIF